ncbi:hypothetical protein EHS25_004002 [Saitozyma podzolica]|uniref:Major facilitator superfamily (MFS) profile domain-containing protein n=1 Tax=Saitozyma podzolica TaxID=1890683 RepID=A0A427YSZ5_9TREE|nr:hypothetical protein EHS25_004002 [Saitozyma podzolica]
MSQTINNAPGEEKATITVVEDVRRGAPTEAVVKKQIDELNAGHAVQMNPNSIAYRFSKRSRPFERQPLSAWWPGSALRPTLTSSIVANKGFIRQFGSVIDGTLKLNPPYVSAFGGLFSAGQVIGQFCIQWITDWVGRKGAMWTFMAILILAAVVECVSSIWWHFAIAKLIAGVGIGACQATLPVYINEHAPVQVRGLFIVAYNIWWSLGGLMCSIALYELNANLPYNWKIAIYTQFAMIGTSLIIFIFLPESTWWLVSKGKIERARKTLEYRFGAIPGYDIDGELSIIAVTIEKQRHWDREAKAEGPLAIFKGLNGKRFLIGSWPKVLQQFVGLGVFSSYSTYFFQLAGNSNAFQVTLIQGCLSLLAVILDAMCVDVIGRRRMTLFGFSGACAGVLIMAIVGCFDYTNKQLGSVLVFSGVLANFCNTFQSSTSYAYLTEMPEQRFKARATGWGLAYCNLYAVMFNFTIPLMLSKWVVKTAFLFAALGIP